MRTGAVRTVSEDGRVTIPGATQSRWNGRQVVLVDLGDRIVMRLLADDPISDLRGKHRHRGPSSDQSRQDERRDDEAHDRRA